MASPVSQLVRFDSLDLRAGELRNGGTRIRLQEQPLQVLQALLESPGEVVTREELQKRIWPADTFVYFDHGLHAAVNRLRNALNDSADRPRYVETVARRGYRFIGHIQGVPPPPAPSPATPEKLKIRTKVRNSWTGVLVCFVITVALGGLLVAANVYGLRDWIVGGSVHHAIRSLAVLPLENLTADPKQEYIAEGMTEDLITQLSKTPQKCGIKSRKIPQR